MPLGGDLKAFYWCQIFALDSAAVVAQFLSMSRFATIILFHCLTVVEGVYYRKDFLCGYYRCVNSGKSLTN